MDSLCKWCKKPKSEHFGAPLWCSPDSENDMPYYEPYPVASDARELMGIIYREWAVLPIDEDAQTNIAVAEIERYAAERERKAREEEREACADRAEVFYRNDCGGCGEFEQWPCHVMPNDSVKANCAHVKMLRAAIKEATK